MIPRSNTFTQLLKSKTIGYFGGLCLLFNAMTGPGIPFTPHLFGVSGSGAFMAIASFAFFSLVSGFSVLLIIETMQAIPGNKHFQVGCLSKWARESINGRALGNRGIRNANQLLFWKERPLPRTGMS